MTFASQIVTMINVFLLSDETVTDDKIRMNRVVRNNLRVRFKKEIINRFQRFEYNLSLVFFSRQVAEKLFG